MKRIRGMWRRWIGIPGLCVGAAAGMLPLHGQGDGKGIRVVEDRLLIFYSGHGESEGDDGFLVPVDAPGSNGEWDGFRKAEVEMIRVRGWAERIETNQEDDRIHVRNVYQNGMIEASYTNPEIIHVSDAHVLPDGRGDLYVKMWDDGYPGSNYTLALNAAGDRLIGNYVLGANGEVFSAEFVRDRSRSTF